MNSKVVVDGYEYLLSHPNPEVAWETGIELTKLIAEPVAAMALAAGDEKGAKKDASKEEKAEFDRKLMDGMLKALRGLLTNLEPAKSFAMVKKILSTVEVQGEVGKDSKRMLLSDDKMINLHFKGRTGSMLKLVVETVRFTHEDFFAAIKNGIAETMAEIKS